MNLIEIKDKNKYNNFIKNQKHSQFQQSWQWGEFQESIGNNIFRYGVEDEGAFKAVLTIVKKKIPIGNYFYAPRGPVFSSDNKEVQDFLFSELKKIAKKHNAIFMRFETTTKLNEDNNFNIKKSIDLNPRQTSILNIEKDEEEILKGMHSKTRYNIRLSAKKGATVREASLEEFDKFWNLMNTTGDRDQFRIHGKEHYKKMLEVDFIKMYFGEYNGKVICAGMFSFFGDMGTYIHGASSNEDRNVMAPFLLQWELIKASKEKECKYYDFHGVDEKKWPGVTRFKRGFKGEEIEYDGTLDLIFNNLNYTIYSLLRKLRRMF